MKYRTEHGFNKREVESERERENGPSDKITLCLIYLYIASNKFAQSHCPFIEGRLFL